ADPEGRMPVLDHLRELRRRLIIALIIIVVGALVAFYFYSHILHFLTRPYCSVPAKYRSQGSDGTCVLNFFGPADGFIAKLKISAIAGVVGTSPLWLYQIWAFVTPGLRKNERRYTIVFVITSSTLFLAGMALAYGVLYTGLRVLIEQSGNGTQATLSIEKYISFIVLLMLVFGASFELPLLIVMLNLLRILPYRILKKWQRLSIFLIFVFAGVATPTADPFTMLAMAIPMLILFELAVLFSFFHDRRRARRQAEEAEPELADDEPSVINPLPERLDSGTEPWSSLP
ncbi:MAG: Sec-independent protein translocase, TatC subunit, partial [Pseudonocardiales bacterium]|nr:Sec-independent protein translocase, TatC subunit [Pseudonocardiales bacterium]